MRKVDISAAFLQSDELKREIYVRLPSDVCDEGKIWRLKKPLYGLNDAGRRFWLKVKKILCDQGLTKLNGDEAFYMKHQNGQLKGMILLHVDDFMIGGSNEFVDGITDVFCKELTVSTIEDSLFRYCGIDMELKENKIIMSMEDYVASLEEADLGKSKKCTKLNKFEQRTFRKITGKLMWLAENI